MKVDLKGFKREAFSDGVGFFDSPKKLSTCGQESHWNSKKNKRKRLLLQSLELRESIIDLNTFRKQFKKVLGVLPLGVPDDLRSC